MPQVLPYADPMVAALLSALENPALKRDVKAPMLSLLGDLALAIGAQFQVRYHGTLPWYPPMGVGRAAPQALGAQFQVPYHGTRPWRCPPAALFRLHAA